MATNRVILLEDDQDLREVFSALLASKGVSVAQVASVGELEDVMGRSADAFDLAILDINLGPGAPSGLDAYRWLKAHDFTGRVAFLTGHARSHPLVSEALRLGDARVYDKPITFQELETMMH